MRDQRTCNIYMINLFELVLSASVGGLIANVICFDCFLNLYTNQFVNGVVYGMIIVNILVMLHLLLRCGHTDLWSVLVAAAGAVLFLAVGILILLFVSDFPMYASATTYLRLLLAGLFSLLLSALYLLNVILLLNVENCTWPIVCHC